MVDRNSAPDVEEFACIWQSKQFGIITIETEKIFTRLLCDNSNSLMYEQWNGESPTLSRGSCVTVHLMQIGFSQ